MLSLRPVVPRAALLLPLLLAACGEAPPPRATPVLRLVDELPRDPGFAAGEPVTLHDVAVVAVDEPGARILDGATIRALAPETPIADGAGTAAVVAGRKGKHVRLSGPTAWLRLLPVTTERPLEVEVHATGSFTAVVVPIDGPVGPALVADLGALGAAIRGTPPQRHATLTPVKAAGRIVHQAVVDPPAAEGAVALILSVPTGEVDLERVRVREIPPLERLAPLASGGRARYAAAADETRESVVLRVPDDVALELTLPADGPRLVGGLAAVSGPDWTTARLRLTVVGETATVAHEAVVRRGDDWTPLALDLTALAGQEVVLTIAAEAEGPNHPDLLVALGAAAIAGAPPRPSERPPDVVLVSLDTVRVDRLEPYGHDRPTSPALAALARQAVVFDQAVSPSTWTLPAHATVFTGRAPQGHGLIEPRRRLATQGARTLAARFREAGYATVACTGGGYVSPEFGLHAGFERYGTRDPVAFELRDGRLVDAVPPARAALLEELRVERRRPRFVFLHTYAAHDYVASDADLEAVGFDAPARAALDFPSNTSDADRRTRERAAEVGAAAAREEIARLYDATLRAADRLVGDLLATLDAAPGRAIVVVFSDHGEELFEHGRVGHGEWPREELIRVPLLLRAPGIAPRRLTELVSLADIAPTVAALAGVRFTPREGRDLGPLLRGGSLPERAVLLGWYGIEGLRGTRLKYLRFPDGERLYRLPDEEHDLAQERVAMTKQLRAAFETRKQAAQSQRGGIEERAVSPETARRLRELGYAGG